MEPQKNNTFRQFLLIFFLGLFFGVIVAYLPQHKPIDNSNEEQEITSQVLHETAIRDSLVLVAKEEALYYREIAELMEARFDSAHAGVSVRLSDIDYLVHTSFESLPDSAKLAYRDKVLSRLKATE